MKRPDIELFCASEHIQDFRVRGMVDEPGIERKHADAILRERLQEPNESTNIEVMLAHSRLNRNRVPKLWIFSKMAEGATNTLHHQDCRLKR